MKYIFLLTLLLTSITFAGDVKEKQKLNLDFVTTSDELFKLMIKEAAQG